MRMYSSFGENQIGMVKENVPVLFRADKPVSSAWIEPTHYALALGELVKFFTSWAFGFFLII